MSDQLPDELIPDGAPVLGDHECPGCGDPLPEPSVPYGKIDYKNETWHMECAYADSDSVEKVEPPRFCRNCHGISTWHPVNEPADVRLCFTCGGKYIGEIRHKPEGPPFDRTEQEENL